MTGKKPITKDMTLGELVRKYPEAAMVLANRGMHCIGCGMAAAETIEQGARAHGMSDTDIEELMHDMNRVAYEERIKRMSSNNNNVLTVI